MSAETEEEEANVNLATLIAEHIHSPNFFQSLLDDIDAIKSKPDTKAKLKFELMSYALPKIKAKDEEVTQHVESIKINFVEARPPEEDHDDIEEDDKSPPISEDVPSE